MSFQPARKACKDETNYEVDDGDKKKDLRRIDHAAVIHLSSHLGKLRHAYYEG